MKITFQNPTQGPLVTVSFSDDAATIAHAFAVIGASRVIAAANSGLATLRTAAQFAELAPGASGSAASIAGPLTLLGMLFAAGDAPQRETTTEKIVQHPPSPAELRCLSNPYDSSAECATMRSMLTLLPFLESPSTNPNAVRAAAAIPTTSSAPMAVGLPTPTTLTDAELAHDLAAAIRLLHSPRAYDIYRQQFSAGRFDLMQLIRLAISGGVGSQQALHILNDFASPYNSQYHTAFTAEHLTVLIPHLSRPRRDFTVMLEDLSIPAENHFQSSHVQQLVAVMQEGGHQMRPAAQILINLVYHKPGIFAAEHLDPMIKVSAHAGPTFFSNRALAQLAQSRRELFTADIVARMKVANENPDVTYQGCLQKALDILAPDQRPPAAVPAPPRYVAPAPHRIAAPALEMPPKAAVPGHIQVAEVLQIAPAMVATYLEAIGHVTREGLAILTRCQSDATFRNTLTTALLRMQREAIYSSWAAVALKQVQKTAATRSDLELD